MIKGLAVLAFAMGTITSATAQSGAPNSSVPKLDLAINYSYMRANATPGECGCFSLNGGSAEGSMRIYRTLSAVADVTGEHAGMTSVPGQSLSLLIYTGGPRVSYSISGLHRTRLTPFLQGLVGAVHGFDAPFPGTSGTLSPAANALALLVGGGVDIDVSHRFAVRAIQADYGLNHLPNGANSSENLLRISAGLVFHIR